jgi:Domain of unknown function (DUF4280)
MAKVVVEGAVLQCTCGSKPSQLTVTSQTTVQIETRKAATVEDKNPGVNVPPFGTCQVLGGPCVPAFPGPWLPGSTSMLQITSRAALLPTDVLPCSVAGQVRVVDPGQTSTNDT